MELIDSISVVHEGGVRRVELLVGDLIALPKEHAVDVLIVSAFPNDYLPTPGSLIGALSRAGVSVEDLAGDKEVDLRSFSSCWLSRPVAEPGVNFRRILCFEPNRRGKAPEVVGDVFRSIIPFTAGDPPISKIAMPLLAAGDQGESPEVMLQALTDAAVHWLSSGLSLDSIAIVLHDFADLDILRKTFDQVKSRYTETFPEVERPAFRWEVFISYSHKDGENVDVLVRELQAYRPKLRIFRDCLELRPGFYWQQHIFDALDDARKIICIFSPDYLGSKVCQEEFNIARFRHRETDAGVILPIYLHTAMLPTYMKLIHYEDAREGDRSKLARCAERLLSHL